MALYQAVWTLFGILIVQTCVLANDNGGGKQARVPETIEAPSHTENDHTVQKRYTNGLTGNNDMGYPGYTGDFGYFPDEYPEYPEKRHASRWALIHRKLAELENSKRFNYYPMDAEASDDKRSPSRWRLIHNRLKQLQKREVRRNYDDFVY